jgi:DNA-binding transcriptional MerR regulator
VADRLTIEQLAAETGMTVRTIREHRARGLLPPPEVDDRVGYYGPDHVARLRIIRDLQAEGFNLRGIKRLLDRSGGQTAEHLLGIKDSVMVPFETEEPQVVTLAELAERFGPEIDFTALGRAERMGLIVKIDDEQYELPSPTLLEAATEVVRQGVPLTTALTVVEQVQRRCEDVSRAFVKLYMDELWRPFKAAGYPEDQWPQKAEAIQQLRPIASRAMLAVFQQTMTIETERAFRKELEKLAKERG